MGRAEMRLSMRSGMTEADALRRELAAERRQREAIVKAETKKLLSESIEYLFYAVAITAHDKLGFGKERLNKYMSDVMRSYDSVIADYATYDDYKETLKAECDFTMDFK